MLDSKVRSTLELKVGAQVVLLVNKKMHKLVNGSRGVVVGFEKQCRVVGEFGVMDGQYNCPVVKFDSGCTIEVRPHSFFQAGGSNGTLVRVQCPLKLAWAITVHKSQGMTLSRLELQLTDAFEYGQAYVALSRATDLNGLWINGSPLTRASIKVHPHVIQFYNGCTGTGTGTDAG